MKNDKETKIQELKDLLLKFRDKRDWAQFHDPKNLAEAISIEAGELQELFLWKDKEQISQELKDSGKFKEEVGDELADVINYCLNFANTCNLDISSIVRQKVAKADKKYPIEKAKGKSIKYDRL
jgi:NTP pyrophosphatase (non-canonical NTP hydrolase)